jgi:integrase
VALKLMALLFPRPGELRKALWKEFDLQDAIWTIPAERMKGRLEHHVSLPRQALSELEVLQEITGDGDFVFPNTGRKKQPLSENTLNAALRRLGYDTAIEHCAHGFRSTASTLLNECGKWHPDAIERQLAHIEENAVRRVYARGQHWDERVKMMEYWAEYLDVLRTGAKILNIARI